MKEKTWIIYCATSPNGKRYIGLTGETLEKRKYRHIKDSKNSQYRFHKAIRKYSDLIVWSEIETDIKSLEIASDREKFYIDLYKTHDFNFGYNCTLGGQGNSGQNLKYGKKTVSNFYVFNLIDFTLIGSWCNMSQCSRDLGLCVTKISACLANKRGINKVKNYHITYNANISPQELTDIKNSRSINLRNRLLRPFNMYKNNELVNTFLYIECLVGTGLRKEYVSMCLRGIKDSYKGYTFKYV